jgi:hypothetical protein
MQVIADLHISLRYSVHQLSLPTGVAAYDVKSQLPVPVALQLVHPVPLKNLAKSLILTSQSE